MGYLQIRWDSQMQNVLLLGTWHPHPHHQEHKGVGHVHLGALWNHLQGYMGCLQICWDSLMQNLLLGWTTGPGTHTTAIRDHKEYAMCLLGPSGST